MSAPPNPNRHNASGHQPDEARADHLEREHQRLTAEISHLTTELNRLKATDQEQTIEKLKAKLRNKIKSHRYERTLRKQYAAEKDEKAEALRRSVAKNEELQRRTWWLEDMILCLEVDSECFEPPKAPNAKPKGPDSGSMELDSESKESLSDSGESDISEEL